MKKSKENIKRILKFIDYTSIELSDSRQSLLSWIQVFDDKPLDLFPAAVCVYPHYGTFLRSKIPSSVKLAVVGGFFPHTQTFCDIRYAELKKINESDVDEVDVVLKMNEALAGDWDAVKNDLIEVRKVTKGLCLKVILETGLLIKHEIIEKAAQIAISIGADFIKISTGKNGVGANIEAVSIMADTVKKHFNNTGIKIGIKPSGGIRTFEDAVQYYELIADTLGDEWLNPDYFRIGASSLYKNLLTEIYAK